MNCNYYITKSKRNCKKLAKCLDTLTNLSYLFKIIKKTKCFESYENIENTYELFGLDFMIDDSYHVWLIEVNTNPCLEIYT